MSCPIDLSGSLLLAPACPSSPIASGGRRHGWNCAPFPSTCSAWFTSRGMRSILLVIPVIRMAAVSAVIATAPHHSHPGHRPHAHPRSIRRITPGLPISPFQPESLNRLPDDFRDVRVLAIIDEPLHELVILLGNRMVALYSIPLSGTERLPVLLSSSLVIACHQIEYVCHATCIHGHHRFVNVANRACVPLHKSRLEIFSRVREK